MQFLNTSITRTLLFFLWLLVPAALVALPAPTLDKPADAVTLELLRSQLDGLESSSDVDEATKTAAAEMYRKAISNLEIARSQEEAAARFQAAIESAPKETHRLREELARKKESAGTTPPAFDGMGLDELVQRLQQEQANLAAVEAKLGEFETELKKETDRPDAIRALLAEANSKKTQTEADLAMGASGAEPAQITQARQALRKTELESLRTQTLMLDQELLSQGVRIGLLEAQRDLTEFSVRSLRSTVAALESSANAARQRQADLAKDQAQVAKREAAGKHPLVQQLADRNASLSETLNPLAAKLEGLNALDTRAIRQAAEIEQRLSDAQQKIEIAGLSQALGQLLMEESRSLPDTRVFNRQAAEREREIAEISLARLQLREERRSLRNIDDYVADLTQALPETAATSIRSELSGLASQRRDLIDQAIDIEDAYLRALGELDFAEGRVLDVVTRYEAFLAEHLLWVRTSPPAGLTSMRAIPGQAGRLLSPREWAGIIEILGQRLPRSPYLAGAALLFALVLWNLRRLYGTLKSTGANIGRLSKDRLRDTFHALVLILLLATPIPLLLFTLGRELSSAIEASQFAKAVGHALEVIAPLLFSLQALRIFLRPGSVAAAHFHWSAKALEKISHDLRWFIPAVVLSGFVTIAATLGDPDNLGSGLGRLAFVVMMGVLALFFFRLSRPGGGILWLFFTPEEHHRLLRLRPLWSALLVLPPVAATVVALLGFLYTGATLIHYILRTHWFLLILLVTHQFVYRWLLLNRQRLALKAARARRDALRQARAAREEGSEGSDGMDFSVDEGEVDLIALDKDSRRLLNAVFVLASLAGAWLIWREVLPAFSFFDETTLWTYTSNVDGAAKLVPITLADLLSALLIILLTLLAVRRLPSLLEIAVLQRLDMTPAGRYTATTLATYTIVAIGTAVVFSALGGSWSEIQWIFAALGVGIGFGLQEIVANFISGLIILFERPIRVGDVVTVGDTDGVVTKIRIRATTIRNWDRKELLVPNKEFITQRLLNWSLSDQLTRLVIDVGIDYGGDVERALLLLEEAARENPRVLDEPPPFVTFENFGDNALTLSLKCFVESTEHRLTIMTELRLAINQQFKAAGIVIAFPQRDVHLDTTRPLDIRIHRKPVHD
ncbi:MAG: mechanosensitive ion channel domain-containing protein [Sedimenticolaceae bacterium]